MTKPTESQVSLLLNGLRIKDPSIAKITDADTAPVKRRLPNSINECDDSAFVGVKEPLEHFGQVGQPRPDPVKRTAAPVTMIAAIKKHAMTVK